MIKDNLVTDKVTIINKKIEDVILGEDIPKVDIIISEWMGFCLLYEGMLDSVIYARDKFLKKDGFIFPERAKIYIAGINDYQMKSRMDGFYTDGR